MSYTEGMVTLLSLSFWFYFLYYSLSSFLIFFVPGFILLHQLTKGMHVYVRMSLAWAVGLIAWVGTGYVVGFADLRTGLFFYVLLCLVGLFLFRKLIVALWKEFIASVFSLHWGMHLLIIVGVAIQLFQVFGSGLVYNDGVHLYRTNAYDGVFHLGLIENLQRDVPPEEPSAAGLPLANYHYWTDLVIADQSRVFGIPPSFIFFQFFPLLLSLLTVVGLLGIVAVFSGSSLFTFFALFLMLFGSDAGFLISLLLHGTISFQYPVIDNGATQFLNLPHTFAKAVFFPFLVALLYWYRTHRLSWGVVAGLIASTLFAIKVYFGLFSMLSLILLTWNLFINELHSYARHKKKYQVLFICARVMVVGLLCILTTAFVYLPANKNAGGLHIYPLEWPKLFINQENFDWKELRDKWAVATYEAKPFHILLYSSAATIVCIVAVYGVRLFGFIPLTWHAKKFGSVWYITLWAVSVVFVLLGLFTLQESGGFNVFNFFVVSSVVASLFLALTLEQILVRYAKVGAILVILICGLSLPRIAYETQQMYARHKQGADVIVISPDISAAYDYIAKETPPMSVIASAPTMSLDSKSTYMSAYGKRRCYFCGEYILETHNQPFKERKSKIDYLFGLDSYNDFVGYAQAIGVDYVFITPSDKSVAAEMLRNQQHRAVFGKNGVFLYDMESL